MDFSWPCEANFPITQHFGENPAAYSRFGLKGHNGIDISLPEGTPVKAAGNGLVVKVGNDPEGYGLFVKIRHDDGIETLYGHLSRQLVVQGDSVAGGQAIGKSGNTGNSTGPHVHFEIRVASESKNGYFGAVDPLKMLDSQPYEDAQVAIHSGLVGRVKAEAGLNVRSGPGIGHTRVGQLAAGSEVQLVELWGMTADGRWVAVYYNGETLLDLE